jgi:3-dehydroquinate synthase
MREEITLPKKRVTELMIPSGERSKSHRTLTGLYDFVLDEKISRSDFILACGGGVTTDLVGYAAATTLRGIRWGAVPTTLVGMVDAAIGGKTGINHALGKNLIGAFWQPSFVCSDVRFLQTLEPRQMTAGLGEVLKCVGLVGRQLASPLEHYLRSGDSYRADRLIKLVSLTAAFKARVVERDERESGRRMILNFGHTFAHGIEKALGFGRLLHGEAVILGILAALRLGALEGYDSKGLREYRDLVRHFVRRLPRRRIEINAVLNAMAWDKKRLIEGQKFVLLERPGKPIITDRVHGRSIRTALTVMLADYRAQGGQDA